MACFYLPVSWRGCCNRWHSINHAISSFLQRIPRDFFTATVGAWLFSFDVPKISQFGTAATYLLWVIVGGNLILSFTFLGLFVWRKEKKEDSVLSVLIVGLLLFILGASVIWVLELPLKIEFAWDRMTIGLIPGVALLIGLIADSIHNKSKNRRHPAARPSDCVCRGQSF